MVRWLTYYLIVPLLCSNVPSDAQVSITGRVINSKTEQPVAYANVFIANSMLGVSTDENGEFELNGIAQTQSELIISHVSYNPFIRTYSTAPRGINGLTIRLKPNVTNLEEVTVVSKEDNKWKRLYKQFEKEFLGNSFNASQCQITNPWVIDITKTNNNLTAKADKLIVFENKATGYKITFLLEKFIKQGQVVTYGGKPLFEEIRPANNTQRIEWKARRETTYRGSRIHFLKSLKNNTLEQEGFKMYTAKQVPNTLQFEQKAVAKREDIFIDSKLQFSGFLKVIYINEPEEDNFAIDNMQTITVDFGNNPKRGNRPNSLTDSREKQDYQTSYLFSRVGKHKLFDNGQVDKSEYLLNYGYWGWERIAEILPFEYEVNPSVQEAKPQTKLQTNLVMNGFELSKLLIPYNEIKSGGPPKDGIPSINNPQFVKANNSTLMPTDMVLGIEVNGLTKAYPIKIMDWHEIVNDQFGDQPVVVTYCPLCGSGIAFDALINGQTTTFGVSGLLFNSDVLLFDRQTESLWSQLEMKAVSGKQSGIPLKPIATAYITWKEWKSMYPSTLVLSENTGYTRNYNQSPYVNYVLSDQLMFPVAKEDNSLPRKTKVIGLSINGLSKAYPLEKLKKLKEPFVDSIGDNTVTIKYSKSGKTAMIYDENGNVIPTIQLYWFAWYAFHPDTLLF